jgi:hypothetical protein
VPTSLRTGPAQAALARGQRIGATVWLVAVLALLGLGIWLAWGAL